MNLTGTENAVRILKELVANWDKIRAGLFATRSIKGSGIAQVTNSSDGVVIHVPPTPVPPTPTNPDGSSWFKVKSSSSVGTNQWNYKGRVMKSGDTSSLTGLVETADTTEFDLRNAVESVALGGMSDIGSLNAIATDSVVRAWPEIRNGVRVYVFERVNDVECPA